jgi:serine/threonine protein kinase
MARSDVVRDDADSSDAAAPLQPGSILGHRYRIIQILGQSPMATVYVAEHLRLGRWDAVKVPHKTFVPDEQALARYARAAQLLSRLRHENVAAVYDFSVSEDGCPFLAMEYIRGQTLQQVLNKEGALPVRRALTIAVQIADALQAAHDCGVVHRRLRPSNVILVGTDEAELVKVVDFDFAVSADEGEASPERELGSATNSPEFMSPEQAMGDTMDGRSDVYSLALIVHRMLTGRQPFEADSTPDLLVKRLTVPHLTLRESAPDKTFSVGLQAVLDSALQRDPADRTPTANTFAVGLRAVVPALPRSERTTAPRRATMRPVRPNRADASDAAETLFTPTRILSPAFPVSTRRVSLLTYVRERFQAPLAAASIIGVSLLAWWGWAALSSMDLEPIVEAPVIKSRPVETAVTPPGVTPLTQKSSQDQIQVQPARLVQEVRRAEQSPRPAPEPNDRNVMIGPRVVETQRAIPAATLPEPGKPVEPASTIRFRDLRTAISDQMRAVLAISAAGAAAETSLIAIRDTAEAAWGISTTQSDRAKAAYVLASVFFHLKNREEGLKWSKRALTHCQEAVLEPQPAIVNCESYRLLVEMFEVSRSDPSAAGATDPSRPEARERWPT